MPHRRQIHGISVVVILAIAFATIANVVAVSNAMNIRDNCRRVSALNAETRDIFEQSLHSLKEGEQDSDYQRFFGPDWQKRKQESINRLRAQVDRFPPLDCTVTILRWIKGD